jgi:signal transduction histidine kinase/ActR/RegA family two-component response regulator
MKGAAIKGDRSGKPDRWATDHSADQLASDAAQSASDADQAASNADQTAAEQDQAAAANDQHASDQDQARADQQWHVDAEGVASGAYVASRATRAASTLSRHATQAARARTGRSRINTASGRDAMAAARDRAARRRDVRAEVADRSVAASEVPLDQKFDQVRASAAASRVRAAADRDSSALDRAEEAYERSRLGAERIVLEEQLRQSQKMEGIGQLAGGIAHDFNNLVTAIRGNASLALAELPPGEGPREDLEQIEQAADRAASLTRNLLAFARRTVLRPEAIDLGAIVRGLEPMLCRLIGEDIALITITPASSGCVMADPGQMEQVIVNLVVNARDAMPDGGTLTIATADVEMAEAITSVLPAGPMTALSVTDTGVGMDADTLGHMFEPFFTTKGPDKGTGLGLAMVYGIVHQSNGIVTVSSEPGHGSIFTVLLPRVQALAPAVSEPPRQPEGRASETGTILLVEDDSGVRRFASRILQAAGYHVLTASDGATAIEVSDGEGVQLLLTDVVMPGMSGGDLASRLATIQPGIRVLYMSGYPSKDIVHDNVLGPEIHFIAKPFTAEALLAAVKTVMSQAGKDLAGSVRSVR